jgi:hypothetical protein
MNQHVGHPETSQAAEGLPRRRWSVTDVRRMISAGILAQPRDGTFHAVSDHAHWDVLTPLLVPDLAARFADLGLTPEA